MNVEDALTEMIQLFRTDKYFELEASVRMENGNGLPYDIFKMLYDRITELAVNDTSLHTDPCIQYIDMYTDTIRTRSMVGFKQRTISKTRVRMIECVIPERPGIYIRFSLKKETPVTIDSDIIRPTLVRICQRWSFQYNNAYSYDFTKVATGTDRAAACDDIPVYELELELHHSAHYLNGRNDISIAKSMCAKVLDLCGRYRYDTDNILIEDPLILQLQQ